MKKLIFATGVLLAPHFVTAAQNNEWSYSGNTGPEYWSSLSHEYARCSNGKNQSPIDIDTTIDADLDSFDYSYGSLKGTMINKGYTLQLDFESGNSIEVDNIDFELKQLHFHTSSEHTFDEDSYPLEMHLVHADQNGNLAVVAVVFQSDELNRELAQILALAPSQKGDYQELAQAFNPAGLLPDDKSYFRYNGSLTTPPCDEGVRWLVMRERLTASDSQINKLNSLFGNNSRPVQPQNARAVLQ